MLLCGILFILTLCLILYVNKLLYFKSKKWNAIKQTYEKDIDTINYVNEKAASAMKHMYFHQDYICAKAVVKNAKQNPFKFVCKYFNLESTSENIDLLTNMSSNFKLIRHNINDIAVRKNHIVKTVSKQVPVLVKLITKNIDLNLGFKDNIVKVYYPEYRFVYKTTRGREKYVYSVVFTTDIIDFFVNEMVNEINYRNHIKLQRSLMTDKLRDFIKKRDNYTCQICGDSIYKNPHIEFHIDHIIPVSKGGITEEENLQTLCASCNLHKSNKI